MVCYLYYFFITSLERAGSELPGVLALVITHLKNKCSSVKVLLVFSGTLYWVLWAEDHFIKNLQVLLSKVLP